MKSKPRMRVPAAGAARRAVALAALVVLSQPGICLAQSESLADSPRLQRPRSRLNRPYEAPVFVVGRVGLGGRFGADSGARSFSGGFVLRPAEASNFLDFLYDSNTALVLQGDYLKLGEDARALSADGLLRHYLACRDAGTTQVRPFLGGGVGATDVMLPAAAGGGSSRYWSLLLETGQEWVFEGRRLFVVRAQLRRYLERGQAFTSWSVAAGLGLPLPW